MNSERAHSSYSVRIIWLGQSGAANATSRGQGGQERAWAQRRGSQLAGQRGLRVQENAGGADGASGMGEVAGQRGSEVKENAESIEVLVQVNRAQAPTVADLSEALFSASSAGGNARGNAECDVARDGEAIHLVIDGREFASHVLLDDCPLFEGVEVMPIAEGTREAVANMSYETAIEVEVMPAAEGTREASSYLDVSTSEAGPPAADFQATAMLAADGMSVAATGSTALRNAGSAAPSAAKSATPRSVVAVIGGIDSGQQIGLGAHPVVVGRSPAADLRIDHPEVSQRHMQIQHRQVLDLDSSNGVTIEGHPAPDRAEIEPEQRIGIGGAAVTWRLLEDDSLDVSGSPPKLMFNRPPRSLPPAPAQPFRLAGKRSDGGLLPVRPPTWATFAIPLALGLVLAVLFNPYMALFALLGPAMAVSSWLEGRGRNKKDLRSRKRQTAKDREAFKAHCRRAAAQEAARRRFEHPDTAACLQWATAPSARLWERSRADDDFLHLSIGRYDASWLPPVDTAEAVGSASASQVPEELADLRDSTTLPDVPFIADFSKGVIGIVGTRREALARWLVMQAATRYGPSDLNIAVVGSQQDWGWASWLPHFRSAAAGSSATGNLTARNSAVGNAAGNSAAGNAIGSLADGNSAGSPSSSAEHTLAVWAHPSAGFAGDREAGRFAGDRIGGRGSGGGTEAWTNPSTSLPHGSRSRFLGGTEVLANSAANSSGASLLILAETPDELPSDCSVSIQLLDDAGRCRVTGWPRTVLADGISRDTARQAALRLARFEDPLTNAAGLPQIISLVSLLGLRSVNDICAERAQQEWHSNSMSAPIGWSDGEIVYLDLPADGPHGLIAGTTGSGKSELMRCLVASLAFTASPEQLNFVLIDYKGGSAFDACAGLPHVVGLVTDLDERLGERALICLRAELAYREQFLRDAQAASISELSTGRSPSRSSGRSSLLPAGGEAGVGGTRGGLSSSRSPLPRLLVVIDEFAALASELPGFLESLVDIAQRGRSLGVHLLLGTQRPAGVVSPSIRSNTNIRIGLRMLDPHDSEDVIGTPAAAAIEQGSPGRAYVRYGSGQPMPFQVAAVSDISPSPSDKPVVVETAATETVTAETAGVETRMAMQTKGGGTGDFGAWHSETVDREALLGETENFEIKSNVSGGSKGSNNSVSLATETKTDLQRLVAAIGEAWEQTESQPLRCPWPEPLPSKLDLEELQEQIASAELGGGASGLGMGAHSPLREQVTSVGSGEVADAVAGEVASFVAGAAAYAEAGAVALGLEDHPEEQTQRICFWYPAEKNLLLIGLTGSGASETLLTAVLQMAKARDASALQIFGIDYGTSNLSQLADLPHCQSILGPAEIGQRTELLEFMFAELAKRQTKGKRVGSEALLLIDNLGALLHALEDERDYRRIEKLTRLYLDGPSWGITTVSVAESLAAVPRKFFSAATMQLLFRVSDSSPYGPANIDASRLGFGRAFIIGGGSVGLGNASGALAATGGMTRGGIANRAGVTGPVEVQAAVVPDSQKAISDITQDPAELAIQSHASPKPQQSFPQESSQFSPQDTSQLYPQKQPKSEPITP